MKIFLIVSVLGIGFAACEVEAQTAPTATSSRRTYPGGRDDSDLSVQVARKVVRKGDDVEIDYHGPASEEPTEGGSSPPVTVPVQTDSTEPR